MNIKSDENWKNKSVKVSDFLEFIGGAKLMQSQISKTVAEAVGEWLMDLKIEQRTPRTIQFYRETIKPFIDHVGSDYLVDDITSIQVKAYFTKTDDGHPYAHHARYRTLRRFLNWSLEQGYIPSSPLTVKPPKLPDTLIPIFTDDEIMRLIKSCKGGNGLRDQAIILTFCDTGMRLSELVKMTLEDVDLDAQQITIIGKGRKQRKIWISKPTMRAIWNYLKSRKSNHMELWLSEERKPLTNSGVKQIVRRLVKEAGITGKKASCHVFRHTFSCIYLDSGGSEADLMYLLGHSSLKMTEKYSRATRERRALKAQEKFSPVDRLGLR